MCAPDAVADAMSACPGHDEAGNEAAAPDPLQADGEAAEDTGAEVAAARDAILALDDTALLLLMLLFPAAAELQVTLVFGDVDAEEADEEEEEAEEDVGNADQDQHTGEPDDLGGIGAAQIAEGSDDHASAAGIDTAAVVKPQTFRPVAVVTAALEILPPAVATFIITFLLLMPLVAADSALATPAMTLHVHADDAADPLLPVVDYIALSFPAVALADLLAPTTLTYTVAPGAAFSASTTTTSGNMNVPSVKVSAASAGETPTYSQGHHSLQWQLRPGVSINVSISTANPRAFFSLSPEGDAALYQHLNAYEDTIQRSGSAAAMAADPLCQHADPAVFKCCGQSPTSYQILFLNHNASPVTCTAPSGPSSSAGRLSDGNFTIALDISATTIMSVGDGTHIIARADTEPFTLFATADNSTSHVFSVSSVDALGSASLRRQRHVINVSMQLPPETIDLLAQPRENLRARAGGNLAAGDQQLFCRPGGPAATPSAADPNSTAPFFAPSWMFGPARNQIGYASASYLADKLCTAPHGFYTSIGTPFDATDQFASVRTSARYEHFFPRCRWPWSADPAAGIRVDSFVAPTASKAVGVLRSFDLDCDSVGPASVAATDASIALAASESARWIRRRHPVVRVADSFSRTATETVGTGTAAPRCVLALDAVVALSNVDDFEPTMGTATLATTHVATNCDVPSSQAACTTLLQTAAATTTARSSAVTVQPVSGSLAPAETATVSVRRHIDIGAASAALYAADVDVGPSAPAVEGTTFVQVVEALGLQSAMVAVRWALNWSDVLDTCNGLVVAGRAANVTSGAPPPAPATTAPRCAEEASTDTQPSSSSSCVTMSASGCIAAYGEAGSVFSRPYADNSIRCSPVDGGGDDPWAPVPIPPPAAATPTASMTVTSSAAVPRTGDTTRTIQPLGDIALATGLPLWAVARSVANLTATYFPWLATTPSGSNGTLGEQSDLTATLLPVTNASTATVGGATATTPAATSTAVPPPTTTGGLAAPQATANEPLHVDGDTRSPSTGAAAAGGILIGLVLLLIVAEVVVVAAPPRVLSRLDTWLVFGAPCGSTALRENSARLASELGAHPLDVRAQLVRMAASVSTDGRSTPSNLSSLGWSGDRGGRSLSHSDDHDRASSWARAAAASSSSAPRAIAPPPPPPTAQQHHDPYGFGNSSALSPSDDDGEDDGAENDGGGRGLADVRRHDHDDNDRHALLLAAGGHDSPYHRHRPPGRGPSSARARSRSRSHAPGLGLPTPHASVGFGTTPAESWAHDSDSYGWSSQAASAAAAGMMGSAAFADGHHHGHPQEGQHRVQHDDHDSHLGDDGDASGIEIEGYGGGDGDDEGVPVG